MAGARKRLANGGGSGVCFDPLDPVAGRHHCPSLQVPHVKDALENVLLRLVYYAGASASSNQRPDVLLGHLGLVFGPDAEQPGDRIGRSAEQGNERPCDGGQTL